MGSSSRASFVRRVACGEEGSKVGPALVVGIERTVWPMYRTRA